MTEIESVLKEERVFAPNPSFAARAHIKSEQEYEALYQRSLSDPEGFWSEVAQKLETLEKTLTTQGIVSNGKPDTSQGNPLTMEQHALLAERVWWQKAYQGLADARAAIAEAEEYAHQRGASAAP